MPRSNAERSEMVRAAIQKLTELPEDESKLEILTQLLSTLGDAIHPTAMQLRIMYIKSAIFTGYPDRALTEFVWCIGQWDKDPKSLTERAGLHLLWCYKWIVSKAFGFPEISLDQLEEMFRDMTRRYQVAGQGMRAVHKLQCDQALQLGRLEQARHHFQKWQQLPRDRLSDCPACETSLAVQYWIRQGNDETAIDTAQPILDGKLKCGRVPHEPLAILLESFCRLGDLEQAAACHRWGYRLVRSENHDSLEHAARHIAYLIHVGNLPKALRLFERHLPWALRAVDQRDRYVFFVVAKHLMEGLESRTPRARKLRLPQNFPLYDDSNRYRPAVLREWLADEACMLGERFDARNGNNYFTDGFVREMLYGDTKT